MTPTHHPSAERLGDYALGRLDPSFRLVLEAHLAFCGVCRARIPELAATLEDPLQGIPPRRLFQRAYFRLCLRGCVPSRHPAFLDAGTRPFRSPPRFGPCFRAWPP